MKLPGEALAARTGGAPDRFSPWGGNRARPARVAQRQRRVGGRARGQVRGTGAVGIRPRDQLGLRRALAHHLLQHLEAASTWKRPRRPSPPSGKTPPRTATRPAGRHDPAPRGAGRVARRPAAKNRQARKLREEEEVASRITPQGVATNRDALRDNVEAGGIEPPSRDNSNGSLYMLSRCFDLGFGSGRRQSLPKPSRLSLVPRPTAEPGDQPAVVQPA